jgi:hypothetical protein
LLRKRLKVRLPPFSAMLFLGRKMLRDESQRAFQKTGDIKRGMDRHKELLSTNRQSAFIATTLF